MLGIMGEVAGAASAGAGLLLVFLGSALAGFDSYDVAERESVRRAFRWRAWPALAALVLAVGSCGFALAAKAEGNVTYAALAVLSLAIVALVVVVAAIHAALEIG